MTRYESKLRSEEKDFVKSNEEIIGHFLQILERRTTKVFYELKYQDREEYYIKEIEKIREMESIKHVTRMMLEVIKGDELTEEELLECSDVLRIAIENEEG